MHNIVSAYITSSNFIYCITTVVYCHVYHCVRPSFQRKNCSASQGRGNLNFQLHCNMQLLAKLYWDLIWHTRLISIVQQHRQHHVKHVAVPSHCESTRHLCCSILLLQFIVMELEWHCCCCCQVECCSTNHEQRNARLWTTTVVNWSSQEMWTSPY